MSATNEQIQTYATRFRRRAEQIRALLIAMEDDKLGFDDVYQTLVEAKHDWSDQRTDGPPHLATPEDLLAFNTVETFLIEFFRGNLSTANIKEVFNQMPVVRRLCVTPFDVPVQG